MIKNIPVPDEYYQASLNYMNIAWNMAFEIYKISKQVIEDEEAISEYRLEQKYHLNTSLMLLSQSVELYLKFQISEINPLLTVHLRNQGVNCDFSELQSIDAKDLLTLHDQVRLDQLGSKLSKTFEDVRKKRNKIMHSTGGELHEEASILIQIIKLSQLLYKKRWMDLRLDFLSSSFFTDSNVDTYNAMEEFSVCKEHFSVGDFNQYSGYLAKDFDIRCSYCDYQMDGTLEDYSCIRLTALTFKCVICNEKGKVKRIKCQACNTFSLDSETEACLHCN